MFNKIFCVFNTNFSVLNKKCRVFNTIFFACTLIVLNTSCGVFNKCFSVFNTSCEVFNTIFGGFNTILSIKNEFQYV